MSNTLVDIKNLSVSYFTYAGEVQSVRDVSFTIEKGKTTALVGESGCGKSVTSKSLMGLIEKPGKIKEGSQIIYNGTDILKFTEKQWQDFRGKECSMIFQDALVSLNPTMKIGKQIIENIANHNVDNLPQGELRKKAVDMLKMVGIPDAEACLEKYPHELSGGMRQRVMIATAMITRPNLLIADEPTTALDVTIQAQILELINRLKKERHLSVLFITHDLGVVANMADDIAVMYAGKIVEYGTAEEIFYDPRHPYTWALLSSMPDLETTDRLEGIPGTPPDLRHPPAGDAFAPRNRYAMKIDFEKEPPMFDLSPTHRAASWLLHPDAPETDLPEVLKKRIQRMKQEEDSGNEA